MINIGGKSFKELIDSNVIDDGTYPYADAGAALYKRAFVRWPKLQSLWVLPLVIVKTGEHGSVISLSDKLVNYLPQVKTYTVVISDFLKRVIDPFIYPVMATVMLTLWFAMIMLYVIVALRRNAYHERSVFSSDRRAYKMRKMFLRHTQVKKRIADLQPKGQNQSISYSNQTQIEALKCLLNAKFEVHVRESISTGQVERRFIITIQLPASDEAQSKLENILKKLGAVLTRTTKGSAMFGDGILLPDYSAMQFIAVQSSDKSLTSKQLKGSGVEINDAKTVYESAFPINMFPDKSKELLAAYDKARKWANATADSLDTLLTTSQQRAERIDVVTASKSVTFDYKLPFSLDMSAVDRLPKWIDQTFKTTGSTAEIHAGDLRIIMPLPKEYQAFIDTRALYIEAFGAPETG